MAILIILDGSGQQHLVEGGNSLEEFADSQMSELSCHGKGAGFLFPEVRTVIKA